MLADFLVTESVLNFLVNAILYLPHTGVFFWTKFITNLFSFNSSGLLQFVDTCVSLRVNQALAFLSSVKEHPALFNGAWCKDDVCIVEAVFNSRRFISALGFVFARTGDMTCALLSKTGLRPLRRSRNEAISYTARRSRLSIKSLLCECSTVSLPARA